MRGTTRRPPTLLLDAGLALGLAVATVVAIQVQPQQGADPDPLAYGLVLTIAALVLVRRRWPVAVLLASAAILQVYNLFDYPGLFPAVPLSVALATAWAAGHRVWALVLTAWFVGAPVGYAIYQAARGTQPVLPLLDGILRDVAMFAAVLSLGEVVTQPSRSRPGASLAGRRTGTFRAAAQRAARPDRSQTQDRRERGRRPVFRRHRAVRRSRGFHPRQRTGQSSCRGRSLERALLSLRRTSSASRPREDKDGRRRLHGGRWAPRTSG